MQVKQTDWKIIYTKYEGITKTTVNFLSKELSSRLIREPEVYRIYVLPCEKEGCDITVNAFVVGCYEESTLIQQLVSSDEVPGDGFLVKVIANPENNDGRLVILTSHTEQELFYAAVSFIDDYIPRYAKQHGSNRMPDLIFDAPLTVCSYTEVPDHKTRSVFTWGHSINDYRAYLDNMARLKLNELVLWNDYIPLNIRDIIDYAHAYGIRVILGYSWGWKEIGNKTAEITDESIAKVKELAVREYRDNYASVGCDGIYFQSFTERKEESVGGKLISRMVVDMVNEVAGQIWEITPNLRIIFGLHATSVRNRLDEIARVDERMEILWEDCGEFPYSYTSYVKNEEAYKETLEFTKKILALRGGVGVGLVFKGVMMLDWSKFINQRGPYIMGENAPSVAAHDKRIRANAWREYAADWMQSGERALEMLRYIGEHKTGEVNMCIAGTFDGGIYLPEALCAQMYRNCGENYTELLKKVARRACITVD